MNNAIASEDISNRLKICQERERQLELRENSPHKFYNDKIAKLNEENSTLKKNVSELKSDNNRIQENVTQLNQQIVEKEQSIAKRLADKEREVAANYESRLREKDGIIKSLNSTIDGLKAAVEKAYHIICNICRAAAALWCGKGKFAEYCADFTPKQNALMCAILDYGSNCAREANFPNLAEKIDTEYYIAEDIRNEMIQIEYKSVKQKSDYSSL